MAVFFSEGVPGWPDFRNWGHCPQSWKTAVWRNYISLWWRYSTDHFSGIEGQPSILENSRRGSFQLMAIVNMWLFHYYCPQFRLLPSIPEKWRSPKKRPILTPKKVNVSPEEKSHSPNPYWHPLFAKNGVQIGQILPLWAHLYFTSSYRGSPPCTLSQHPDNRETWYSNVLAILPPVKRSMSSTWL